MIHLIAACNGLGLILCGRWSPLMSAFEQWSASIEPSRIFRPRSIIHSGAHFSFLVFPRPADTTMVWFYLHCVRPSVFSRHRHFLRDSRCVRLGIHHNCPFPVVLFMNVSRYIFAQNQFSVFSCTFKRVSEHHHRRPIPSCFASYIL